jgi:hypothetical protein
MNSPISPWADKAELLSPDGKYRAIFEHGMEVAMGAPTRGILKIIGPSGAQILSEDAAASMVWSDDSRFFAFSEFKRNTKQNLWVFRTSDNQIDRSPEEFCVLELKDFREGKILGVDSPVHMPRTFSFQYREQAEQDRGANALPRAVHD